MALTLSWLLLELPFPHPGKGAFRGQELGRPRPHPCSVVWSSATRRVLPQRLSLQTERGGPGIPSAVLSGQQKQCGPVDNHRSSLMSLLREILSLRFECP